ncbi:cytochrome c biogenesis protein ResB [Stenoxybacter acetivorans]|uniref:cytochrome c biogenesis protein ResB n=1 Tax=Stenoxybacter acetivorans TaxID=422441 RepID=UPI00055DA784|nr:cytochrome c biogenesis protein ResB [Stenoxybacter acetivorans]
MSSPKSKTPLIHRPWFAFVSSMRFAVALLCLLGLASIIGTVLKQNESAAGYLVEFGPFWSKIFDFLGLYDVYSSSWFVLIMLFLVLSTGSCLWRNIPPFLREMRSFRLKATRQSLEHLHHSALLAAAPSAAVAERYLNVSGFATRIQQRSNGETLLAAKKGSLGKLGYICAHIAIIVICLGGLIDSNMGLKLGVLTGRLKPDNNTLLAKDFSPESKLNSNTLSFRGDVSIREGQGADVVFLNTGKGFLVQDLPFSVDLRRFHVDYYDTGMPKNFASDLTITDKKTGKTQDATIKVNHPLTVDGITIYQASFGDGGSDLNFQSWDLASGSREFVPLNAISMNTFPLTLGKQAYQLEFGELRPINVENTAADSAETSETWQQKFSDVGSVNQNKKQQNVGATISYKIRDQAGQAREYMNYISPLLRDGAYFYATGERANVGEPFRWLMLPADQTNDLNTFMAFRQVLRDEQLREKAALLAVQGVDSNIRPAFTEAVRNVLRLFSQGGYVALNDFIQTKIPAEEQDRLREFFYQVLYGSANIVLDEALKLQNGEWKASEQRNQFLLNSLDAYTGLTRFPAPILMQLDNFKEVRSSGLQMTRSPGQFLVYLGSVLLVLGTVFMFYVREKRAWLLFGGNGVHFAMSASRHQRDLDSEFSEHINKLQQLAKDLSHD